MSRSSPSIRKRRRIKPSSAAGFIVLLLLSAIMFLPVYYMVITSLKSGSETLLFPPTFFPQKIMFSNYSTVIQSVNLLLYYKNSLIISLSIVLGTLLSSSLVAFGFARYDAPGKNVLFMILLGTLMIPYPSVMIPQFILFHNLNWIDTYLPMIVPAFFGSAYMVFLLKQFYGSLHDDLFNAARIDGCSEFRTYWNIAVPLSAPALATVAIFSFLWSWDDLLSAVIYINSPEKYTLPVMLSSFSSKFRVIPWNSVMVASICCVIPSILIFAFCQRYFVQGIVTTGLKD